MSLTLRQLQKMFSAAQRGEDVNTDSDFELAHVARFISKNDDWSRAGVAANGSLKNLCDCAVCKNAGPAVHGVRSIVDRWVREHGPNANVCRVVDDERAKANQPHSEQPGQNEGGNSDGQGQGQSQSGDGQGQEQGQSGDGQGQEQGQSEQQSGNQTQTTGPASESDADYDEPEPAPQPQKPASVEQTVSPQQQALAAAKKALQDAFKSSGKSAAEMAEQKRLAKKKLRMARRATSFNKKSEASSVSLQARRQVSRGLGRLGNVPQGLRARMTDLINRLVAQGGTSGDNFGPVPVLSATKLVKRMVVRRPLPNALKEDSVTGRPVVLFLPDISPSCGAQAQPACDLANAAGYAGVPGSDVLVLPHFNGGVDSDEEYIPWFNGKPAATNPKDATRLFSEVCSGTSSYRVRVVVFLGDHDAVDHYGEIARLKSVTRVLWLHNAVEDSLGRPRPASPRLLPDWRPEALAKLRMVSGCVDQRRMLSGFDMALKM